MLNNQVQNNENAAFMNPPVSLTPLDNSFYNPAMLPLTGAYPGPQPTYLPPMLPISSDCSSACSPGLPNVIQADSSLQKLNSTHSISSFTSSVSPCSFTAVPMNFQASSPLLPQPGSNSYNLVAPAQYPFSTVQVSPRFTTTPSVSPQPPMMDQSAVYISPSPLLLTPQQSTSSLNSETTPDIPNVFVTGNTFTLIPPSQSFTASRTPERFVPSHISPAQSPQMPERTTTQVGFRERPMSQPDQQHRAGYPPAKPVTSYQSEVMPKQESASGKRQKKFAYRSKQKKIDRTHRSIQEKFSALGLFARERELVRGDDTLRIHVKTFDGLTDIQNALNEIHNHMDIDIRRVAAVFSKKNRFQKKGFIVYLKVGSIAQVDTCMRLLDRYSETLRNIAIAKSKSSAREPTSEARNSAILQASKGTIEDFVPEVHIPRRLSATAM